MDETLRGVVSGKVFKVVKEGGPGNYKALVTLCFPKPGKSCCWLTCVVQGIIQSRVVGICALGRLHRHHDDNNEDNDDGRSNQANSPFAPALDVIPRSRSSCSRCS